MRKLLAALRTRAALLSIGGLVVGILLASGFFVTLEVTNSQEFCDSCHIMDPFVASVADSNHRQLECNDCHAPGHSEVAKTAFKARAGTSHIWFNFVQPGAIPDVITAKPRSVDAINDNCYACHEVTMQQIGHGVKDTCTDCHQSVPHGQGIYRPDVWHEPMHTTAAD